MLVERIWTGNAYRNFNYLIACGETGEALAIDPLDHGKCLNAAKVRGWQITQVLNTHEHHDHTGGNEAVIATLLAWKITGDKKYLAMHGQVHRWSFEHFADPEFGEWYGYLHRDGSPSSRAKGTLWKGPFHLPRMLWYCHRLLTPAGGAR